MINLVVELKKWLNKNKWNCIKQTTYYMYRKTPDHALKCWFGIFILVWMDIEKKCFGKHKCLCAYTVWALSKQVRVQNWARDKMSVSFINMELYSNI